MIKGEKLWKQNLARSFFTKQEWIDLRWEFCEHYVFKFYGMRGQQQCLELCKIPTRKRTFCRYEDCPLTDK
jgi:hypothetical protein